MGCGGIGCGGLRWGGVGCCGLGWAGVGCYCGMRWVYRAFEARFGGVVNTEVSRRGAQDEFGSGWSGGGGEAGAESNEAALRVWSWQHQATPKWV